MRVNDTDNSVSDMMSHCHPVLMCSVTLAVSQCVMCHTSQCHTSCVTCHSVFMSDCRYEAVT